MKHLQPEHYRDEQALAYALQRIHSLNAVCMVLTAAYTNNHPLLKLMRQLNAPHSVRPARKIDETMLDRTQRYNLQTHTWETVERHSPRGQGKPTQFTKKLSVSLLPRDGKMNLFKPNNQELHIAILFDIEKCHTKSEKYIFLKDSACNGKWWLRIKDRPLDKHVLHPNVSLQQLRDSLDASEKQAIIPDYNELLLGLSIEGVIGIAVLKDTIVDRLNAQRVAHLLRLELNLTVPIVLLTTHQQAMPYTQYARQQDLNAANAFKNDHYIQPLLKSLMSTEKLSKTDSQGQHLYAELEPHMQSVSEWMVQLQKPVKIRMEYRSEIIGWYLVEREYNHHTSTYRTSCDTINQTIYNMCDLTRLLLSCNINMRIFDHCVPLFKLVLKLYPELIDSVLTDLFAIKQLISVPAKLGAHFSHSNVESVLTRLVHIAVMDNLRVDDLQKNQLHWEHLTMQLKLLQLKISVLRKMMDELMQRYENPEVKVAVAPKIDTGIELSTFNEEKILAPFKVSYFGGTQADLFDTKTPTGVAHLISLWQNARIDSTVEITEHAKATIATMEQELKSRAGKAIGRDPEVQDFYERYAGELAGVRC